MAEQKRKSSASVKRPSASIKRESLEGKKPDIEKRKSASEKRKSESVQTKHVSESSKTVSVSEGANSNATTKDANQDSSEPPKEVKIDAKDSEKKNGEKKNGEKKDGGKSESCTACKDSEETCGKEDCKGARKRKSVTCRPTVTRLARVEASGLCCPPTPVIPCAKLAEIALQVQQPSAPCLPTQQPTSSCFPPQQPTPPCLPPQQPTPPCLPPQQPPPCLPPQQPPPCLPPQQPPPCLPPQQPPPCLPLQQPIAPFPPPQQPIPPFPPPQQPIQPCLPPKPPQPIVHMFITAPPQSFDDSKKSGAGGNAIKVLACSDTRVQPNNATNFKSQPVSYTMSSCGPPQQVSYTGQPCHPSAPINYPQSFTNLKTYNYQQSGMPPNYQYSGTPPNYQYGGMSPNYHQGSMSPNYQRGVMSPSYQFVAPPNNNCNFFPPALLRSFCAPPPRPIYRISAPPSFTTLRPISPPSCSNLRVMPRPSCSNLRVMPRPSCSNLRVMSPPSCSNLRVVSPPSCSNLRVVSPPSCSNLRVISPPSFSNLRAPSPQTCSPLRVIPPPPSCTNMKALQNAGYLPRPYVAISPMQQGTMSPMQQGAMPYGAMPPGGMYQGGMYPGGMQLHSPYMPQRNQQMPGVDSRVQGPVEPFEPLPITLPQTPDGLMTVAIMPPGYYPYMIPPSTNADSKEPSTPSTITRQRPTLTPQERQLSKERQSSKPHTSLSTTSDPRLEVPGVPHDNLSSAQSSVSNLDPSSKGQNTSGISTPPRSADTKKGDTHEEKEEARDQFQ